MQPRVASSLLKEHRPDTAHDSQCLTEAGEIPESLIHN